jgi:hypothetical protein
MPRSSHASRFYHPNNIGWAIQIIKLLITLFSPLPSHLVPLRPKYVGIYTDRYIKLVCIWYNSKLPLHWKGYLIEVFAQRNIVRCWLVVGYRYFGTTYRFHLPA